MGEGKSQSKEIRGKEESKMREKKIRVNEIGRKEKDTQSEKDK